MPRNTLRFRVLLACIVFLSLVLPATTGAGVSAAGGGSIANGGTASISGTVTGPGAVPIEGIWANAYWWDSVNTIWVYQNTGTTNPDGTYTIPNLVAGTYYVYFNDPAMVYTPEFYDNKSTGGTATQFTLADAEVRTGVSAELAVASTLLSGTLTDSVSGQGAVRVEATLYKNTGLDTWDIWERVTTRSDGEYAFPGIPDGTYRIQFADTDLSYNRAYSTVFWHDAGTFGTATNVSVAAASPPVVCDQEMDPIPHVTGTVTEDGTGDPLEDITVNAYQWGVGITHVTTTAPDGTYAFYELNNTQYTVKFEDNVWGDGRHRTEWWENASSYDFADAFMVSGGATVSNINASLQVYEPAIFGTVTAEDTGLPLSSASVIAFDYASQTVVDSASTNSKGYYEFPDLLEGTYKLFFSTYDYHYGGRWYDDMSSWSTAWNVYYDGVNGEQVDESLPRMEPQTERVASRTRYATAIEVARNTFDLRGDGSWDGPGVPVTHVVIASGDDRAAADPLAAAGLVHIYDAPLLLVSAAKTPSEVITAVTEMAQANGDITMHVVGGTVSVPNARVNEIKAAAQSASGNTVTVDRILATGGRYDLAAAIARRIKQVHGTPPVVLVANGADPAKFFDALALSPIAASQGYPVLLVSADRVPPATSAVIAEFGSPRVIVGGGPNTVTEAVRKSVGATAQDRWYGQNRYSTATTIAQKAVGEYFCTYQWVGVAAKLPDALTGGSAVGYRGGVLVITDGTTLSSPTATFLEAHDVDIRICLIFGGENSLSEGVRAAIDQKLLLP